MSLRRLGLVFAAEARSLLRRPLFWILVVVLALMMWGLSSGNVRIQSGEAQVGGKKALITSQFAVAMTFSLVISLVYSFFIAVAAGMAVIRDDEQKVGELLHSTPLRPGEYIWGKFAAVAAAFGAVLGLHILFTVLVNHAIPSPGNEEFRGPLALENYLVPAAIFGLPIIVFLAGASFWIGERSRRPILIYFLPVALLLVSGFFLWNWSPSWLDPRVNRLLMLVDPAGFRWLNETWLKVDRGVQFYNTSRIGFDAPFFLSRLAFVAAGIACVAWSQRSFAARLRGARGGGSGRSLSFASRPPERAAGSSSTGPAFDPNPSRLGAAPSHPTGVSRDNAPGPAGLGASPHPPEVPAGTASGPAGLGAAPHPPEVPAGTFPEPTGGEGWSGAGPPAEDPLVSSLPKPLAALAMRSAAPGFVRATVVIARAELRELRSHPGLYLFAPLLLIQTIGSSLLAVGAFDTPVLMTPGTLAVRSANTLTLLVCLLLVFYQVESLQRERASGLGSIWYAAPTRSLSILAGKTAANALMAGFILLVALAGYVIALLIEAKVSLSLEPFALVWGLLLLPTFLLWCAFITFLFALTRSRYTTYGIALAAMALTGYLQFRGKMIWAWNWDIWDTLLWTDMGRFEIDRTALILNRAGAIGLAALLLVVSVRIFPRRELDPGRLAERLRPGALVGSALRLFPLALVPIVAIGALWVQVHRGFQGKAVEKRQKDYWRQNLATWKDAPLPSLAAVDLDLALEPARRWFRVEGEYGLVNERESPLARLPLTGGPHWKEVSWTVEGREAKPEYRSDLYVFTLDPPLAPGDRVRIGFRYEGTLPPGITKNGGGAREFILPSGIVLTSFGPSFVPVLGYQEEIGVKEDENRYEPKVYEDDFWEGINEPALVAGSSFRTKIRITAPEAYTLNSVGTLTSEQVEGGKRTAVWESDHPVRFFNVVGGRWQVRRAGRAAVFHHPGHPYNIDEISRALEASLEHYSQWFHPYPWKELKISEFPALAFYAQGFPTNITFSEGIGFLTRSTPKTELAFMVTAHEAAHQWWGNLLMPGKGPGGEILAEGMAHYSTILLMDQMKGERERIEFCRRIEERYAERRQADSERPLVKIDGSRPGDQTVTYDKGGWVFWMLTNMLGREEALAGIRDFIGRFKDGPDHPLLQDLVETLRARAPDPAAYEGFVRQWFFDVVVPRYELSEARRERIGGGGAEASEGGAEGGGGEGSSSPATWLATVRVKNAGSGRMPVEIAAIRRERYAGDGSRSGNYEESRATVTLGGGEEQQVTIRCSFPPERIVVDPDAKVLQLGRKSAVAIL